jgi:NADH dehydrogenase (ubiquinone) 1 alpha subcomplex subunit 6
LESGLVCVTMAAAGLIKNLRVTKTGSGSSSLAEAQQRATDFFREACRALPSIMDRYNLYDVITLSDLRSKIALEFRKHHHNTNPKVRTEFLQIC